MQRGGGEGVPLNTLPPSSGETFPLNLAETHFPLNLEMFSLNLAEKFFSLNSALILFRKTSRGTFSAKFSGGCFPLDLAVHFFRLI